MRRLLAVGVASLLLTGACGGGDGTGGAAFSVSVTPGRVADVIPGQLVVLIAEVTADEGSRAVDVRAEVGGGFADRVSVEIRPSAIRSGEVAEISIVPGDVVGTGDTTDTLAPDMPPPIGPGAVLVPVTVAFERDGVDRETEVLLQVSDGEDLLEPQARVLLDRFVAWLEVERPELGIDAGTEWRPTIVQPHILVVSHYLFFSERWEVQLMWHVMIAPHDWARIALRARTEASPRLAFEIPSVSDPASRPREIDPWTENDR